MHQIFVDFFTADLLFCEDINGKCEGINAKDTEEVLKKHFADKLITKVTDYQQFSSFEEHKQVAENGDEFVRCATCVVHFGETSVAVQFNCYY